MRLLSTLILHTRDEMRRCGALKGLLGKNHISSPSTIHMASRKKLISQILTSDIICWWMAAEELLYAWPVLCLVFTLCVSGGVIKPLFV